MTTATVSDLLGPVLAKDGWKFFTGRPLTASKAGRQLLFFPSNPPPTRALHAIARRDRRLFRELAIVVTSSVTEMERLRDPKLADHYPRALFTSLEELQVAAGAGGRHTPSLSTHAASRHIASFDATILANIPVGDPSGGHYRLAFKADDLRDIQPPQFFMMDVKPQRAPLGVRAVRRRTWRDAVDWMPQPLLKRPFGIWRDFHPHFPADYLKRLALPPSLAPALHPPAPDRFDILYKVLPHGIGTPLMTKLKPGDCVHMIGPLGQPLDVGQLRADGTEEVHLIGGGVGMAPLIPLVEVLRFHAFRVRVFLGIATLQSLRYRDKLAAAFGEKPHDAYAYVDDLLAAGVAPRDIFLSFERGVPHGVRNIPRDNLFSGFVSEQYRQYLLACHPDRTERPRNRTFRLAQNDSSKKRGAIAAFTCGPNQMMEVLTHICRDACVPLKVLLEKRMGCGIGVCFSCVQKVRRPDGTEDYVRVCKEGPLFDAKDIVWNNDSKPVSVTCGCAARC